jgi:hypothetical protein
MVAITWADSASEDGSGDDDGPPPRSERAESVVSLSVATPTTLEELGGGDSPIPRTLAEFREKERAAARRFAGQVDEYMGQYWKQIVQHMKGVTKRGAVLTREQRQQLNHLRGAVGMTWALKLSVLALVAMAAGLVAANFLLFKAIADVQGKVRAPPPSCAPLPARPRPALPPCVRRAPSTSASPGTGAQITEYREEAAVFARDVPGSMELRLQRLTMPFGVGGQPTVMCRTFALNYTADAHITGFEALSLGYPFGKPDPADKIVRSIALYVAEPGVNITGEAGGGGGGGGPNFACEWGRPAGAASQLLWHWSRVASPSWPLSPSYGIRLPGRAKLVLQVVYDVETGSPDLRSLTAYEFWKEFAPYDESGVRLTLSRQLRPQTAVMLQLGSFDSQVPKLARSTVNHTCLFSEQSTVFQAGADVSLLALSTRTGPAGTAAGLTVERASGSTKYSSIADLVRPSSPHLALHTREGGRAARFDWSLPVSRLLLSRNRERGGAAAVRARARRAQLPLQQHRAVRRHPAAGRPAGHQLHVQHSLRGAPRHGDGLGAL